MIDKQDTAHSVESLRESLYPNDKHRNANLCQNKDNLDNKNKWKFRIHGCFIKKSVHA